MIDSKNVVGDVLGLDATESVVVTLGDWPERRAMMTPDGKVKFRQAREADGEWLLIDFIDPETDEWYFVAQNAQAMQLQVPFIVWSGPVNAIPERLLASDSPLMVRCVDSPGWFDLRREANKMTKESKAVA